MFISCCSQNRFRQQNARCQTYCLFCFTSFFEFVVLCLLFFLTIMYELLFTKPIKAKKRPLQNLVLLRFTFFVIGYVGRRIMKCAHTSRYYLILLLLFMIVYYLFYCFCFYYLLLFIKCCSQHRFRRNNARCQHILFILF